MTNFRKIFASVVMVTMVFAMAPFQVAKAAATDGDLIKMSGSSSVYYLKDGKRFVFPNTSTYMSWYKDFSGVVTIPASELQSYPLGGNVVVRPGTKLVKITTDPTVYAVEPNGTLRSIVSEANAIALWGTDWAKKVIDVPDAFFTNYTIGAPLTAGVYPNGTLVKMAGSSDTYLFDGTNYRKFASEAAFTANRFDFANVLTSAASFTANGATITASEDSLVKTSQGAVVARPTDSGTGLTVALAADTAAGASVPANSPVNFLKINLTASNDGAVSVSSIKLTAYDLGNAQDIDDVTFYDNGVKVGSSKSINSDREATFNFSTPIAISAGATKSLVVKASVFNAGGTYGNYALGITKAADIITGGAAVSGVFPYKGNSMSVVAGSVIGTLTLSTVNATPSNNSFGDDNVLMAGFDLTANNAEDVLLQSIKLKNGGTNTDGIVSNLKLFIDGTEVSTGTYANGYATFAINNFKIAKSDSVTLEVRGDLGTTNVGDSVKFYIKDRTDVTASGVSFGYPVQLVETSWNLLDTSAEALAVSLTTSDFSIDFDKAATPARDVKAGDKEVILATFSMKSNGEAATVNSIKDTDSATKQFQLVTTGLTNAGNIKNVKMVDTVGGTYDITATYVDGVTVVATANRLLNSYILSMTDEISLTKGVAKKFLIKADMSDDAGAVIPANATVKVVVDAGAMDVTGDVSNSNIIDITPNSLTSSIMTVKDATLSWTPVSLTNKTVVTGATNVEVYQASLKTGAADGVKLSSLTLKTLLTDATPAFTDNNITKLSLYLDGKLLKTLSNNIVEPTGAAVGTVTFNSLTTTNAANEIAANKTVDLVVKADFSSSFVDADLFSLQLAAAGDGTVRSITGNKVVNITGVITGGSRQVTLASVGTLRADLVTTSVNADETQYILAGTRNVAGKYLGELKFTTKNEPVKVKTLTLTDSGSASSADIKEIKLVKYVSGVETVVATKTVEADGSVIFDPFDVVFDADQTTSLFIVAVTKAINVADDSSSTATNGNNVVYQIGAMTASGYNSGEDIVMTGIGTVVADNQYDNDNISKSAVVAGSVLNVVTNALATGTLSSGQQEIARYKLVFDNGSNRLPGTSDDYKAQLTNFALTVNQTGLTGLGNLTLRVDGTSREVADSATEGTWTTTELQNATTGLIDAGRLDGEVTLVVTASAVAIDPLAQNYSVQTVISDLDGTAPDSIQYNGFTAMYLPYTSVTGGSLHN